MGDLTIDKDIISKITDLNTSINEAIIQAELNIKTQQSTISYLNNIKQAIDTPITNDIYVSLSIEKALNDIYPLNNVRDIGEELSE